MSMYYRTVINGDEDIEEDEEDNEESKEVLLAAMTEMICYSCGTSGHKAPDCPIKKLATEFRINTGV